MERSIATLPASKFDRVEVKALGAVAVNVTVRNSRNVLNQEPIWPGLCDDTCELAEHGKTVASWRPAPGPAEILAWRTADHTGKVTGRRVKLLNALSENCVRSSHDAEAGLLETAIEQAGARKEG
ncbi:MAG TPA: hypothetical protein VNV43_00135 [Candidatus Acidoferrales bacterium]|nr:hypothetical protein [Candidatus Acidoferrales bacterium]